MKKTKHDAVVKLRYEVWPRCDYKNFTDRDNLFGEKNDFDHWEAEGPFLGLAFYIGRQMIFSSCDLRELLLMSRKSGDYYPAVCPDCCDPGCAGYEYPVRVFLRAKHIIMVIRRPPVSASSSGRHVYRAYRFTRRNFLEELAGVVMTRIRLEDNLKLWHGHTAEKRYHDIIAELWGGRDCAEYQYRISGIIRRKKNQLEKDFLRSRE